MSKYTTELRFICETLAGKTESKPYSDVNNIINTARPLIFSFSYPIYDANYKPELEKKIIKHFYTREIGLESYGLWKLKLDAKMNEIMPYYNQLYESALLQFDPLGNYKYHKTGVIAETGEREEDKTINGSFTSETGTSNTGTNTSTTSTNGTITTNDTRARQSNETNASSTDRTYSRDIDGTYWDKYSDTPQSGVNGLANDTYLTNARKNTTNEGIDDVEGIDVSGSENITENITDTGRKTDTTTVGFSGNTSDTGTVESEGTNTSAESVDGSHSMDRNYVEDVAGYSGVTASKMLMEFRESMLNIDMMIIEELEELFMQLW